MKGSRQGPRVTFGCYMDRTAERETQEVVCCGGWSLVFRGPPCPCRLPGGSLTFRSHRPSCRAPVTDLWMSALGLWMTWLTRSYETLNDTTQIQYKFVQSQIISRAMFSFI